MIQSRFFSSQPDSEESRSEVANVPKNDSDSTLTSQKDTRRGAEIKPRQGLAMKPQSSVLEDEHSDSETFAIGLRNEGETLNKLR